MHEAIRRTSGPAVNAQSETKNGRMEALARFSQRVSLPVIRAEFCWSHTPKAVIGRSDCIRRRYRLPAKRCASLIWDMYAASKPDHYGSTAQTSSKAMSSQDARRCNCASTDKSLANF